MLTLRGGELAADEIRRLWGAVKGGKNEPSLKKPSAERSEEIAKKAAAKLGNGEKRIVADVPEHIHMRVRVKCLERGGLVRDYILELLKRDGIA